MTPIPDRLAQIARETLEKPIPWKGEWADDGVIAFAAAVALRWEEERFKERTERVCARCGSPSPCGMECQGSGVIRRFEYEERNR